MRIETKEYKVYKFNELTDEAKEKVKEWYLQGQEPQIFTDMVLENLEQMFPNSDLKVEYSLSYCQGDGLNIYGTLCLRDFLKYAKENYSLDEYETLDEYCDSWYDNDFVFMKNDRYGYSCKFMDKKYMQEDEIISAIEALDNGEDEINTGLVERFFNDIIETFETLDKEYENNGYSYFYEISEEDLAEICEANNYEFTEDGKLWR